VAAAARTSSFTLTQLRSCADTLWGMPKNPGHRRFRLLAVLVGLIAVAPVTGPAAWASDAGAVETTSLARTPRLPEPSGREAVGTTSVHLNDTSRHDPWVATAPSRELMISLWYPTRARGGPRAPYMTAGESRALLSGMGITDVPGDALSRTRTNASLNAAPAGRPRSRPLVVLSPGFTWSRSSLTALAEDLASHGYVVVGIDHTYETFATTFPDGRVTTCQACELQTDDFGAQAERSRAADVSFVLDSLTGRHPVWKGSRLIDPTRIGMAGSSLGGAASAQTMVSDARVKAGADLDGLLFAPLPPEGLSRPFLLMGQESIHSPGGADEPSWDQNWARLTGRRRWLVVTGSVHASFTDYDLLGRQIGLDLGSRLAGPRSVEITRRYVRAFFDQHLRGVPQPLLRAPSRSFPEVRFCRPSKQPTCS
jgi:dienelactone hydrolase